MEKTGPLHDRVVNSFVNGDPSQEAFPCRCTIGDDQLEVPDFLDQEEEPEGHSFAGAEEIYLSSGMDEGYDFR
ncbi:hypothetical protein [Streptomyces sp. SID9727]|uniref:hypothetical protein n=1 Tax=Streptomyces sp. SID9727 TaxID=2706114 RepID=UPI0013CD60C5|nr:hypothetical protein [Streptomyces sp. SID9727]NEC65539.1 hypothetical protein [Streptomyces sp. SID9727]